MEKINFIIREIQQADLQKGFFQTLSNLTTLGRIGDDIDHILIEQKFIHDGGRAGHIEDVVTRREYEGIGVGSALVSAALAFAKEKNCYKVVLECSEKNVPFYEKNGFRRNEISMRYDIIP